MIALASAFGMLSSYAGLLLSYHRNLPSGPAIVIAAGAIYGFSLLISYAASVGRTLSQRTLGRGNAS
jgi:zinc/manganese transport system permease protein